MAWGQLSPPDISHDGRIVAFHSNAPAEGSGNDPTTPTVWVKDRDADGNGEFDDPTPAGSLLATSLRPIDLEPGGFADPPALSPDGRFVLAGTAVLIFAAAHAIDLSTGQFTLVAPGVKGSRALSRGGLSGAMLRFEFNPTDPDHLDPSIWGVDTAAVPILDTTSDGDLDDFLPAVFDTETEQTSFVSQGVSEMRVAGRNALFLTPEDRIGLFGSPGSDLNADGDSEDEVVSLWRDAAGPAEAVVDLGLAASAIQLSETCIAAIDADTSVLKIIDDIASATAQSWSDTGEQALDDLQIEGDFVAYRSPAGNLKIWDCQQGTATDTGGVAVDFVFRQPILAYRQAEQDPAPGDLNGDLDFDDLVLSIYDLGPPAQVFDTERAVVPCSLDICDRNLPYKIRGEGEGKTVVFFTREQDQGPLGSGCVDLDPGCDLDGNGEGTDEVIHRFDLPKARSLSAAGEGSGLAWTQRLR